MIDRLQKWVKCNFPSPLIGIHGQPQWRLGVSEFIWFESTGKVRLPKCGNCSEPCTFTLLHYEIWYYYLKDNLQPVKNNLWGTPQSSRVVYSVDTVINLLYSLEFTAWELVRLHLHNRRWSPYSKPSKPVSGDGKSHCTNFCNRSIIMQTAVE